ncbi:MAG TPA: aroma-sacti cluster domain-containing protein [Gaiellaceae bacterium]|nr:aroma-sacti cluster domain-containing protein [Gaiellaceae bacterium]
MENGKVKKLRDAGLIYVDELPREYRAVVEGLTDDELDVLLAVKRRLDEADIEFGGESVAPGRPPFTTFMTF